MEVTLYIIYRVEINSCKSLNHPVSIFEILFFMIGKS